MRCFYGSPCAVALASFTLLLPVLVGASSFLEDKRGSLRSRVDAGAFQSELGRAISEAAGCGGQVSPERWAAIREGLLPIWRTLPKNGEGLLERRSLRYLVHRYFNRRSALVIRGFEPSRPANASDLDLLSSRVPGELEAALEAHHGQLGGFGFEDAMYLVATIEKLVADSEASLLERVFARQAKPQQRSLGSEGLAQVLEEYLVHWMMGDDAEGIELLLANRTLLASAFPHWDQLVAFARGQISRVEFERQMTPRSASALSRSGHNALSPRFSFDDAHEVVAGITGSFASFWESECSSMKSALVAMDTHGTGRVPLSKFYSSALETEWRFGESEAYLREMGALDETGWLGKQVIIPNYMQAASNCIVSTSHYLVCCVNDCDAVLSEIEAAVRAPVASPDVLLSLVANLSAPTSLEEDEPPRIDDALREQLQQIAAANGGTVPLHGRLFAQWLHYVFPRVCPFPHKAGAAALVTPSQYGDKYVASDEEMRSHASEAAATAAAAPPELAREELQWMSQWSPEEEHFADYAVQRGRSGLGLAAGVALMLLLAGAAGVASLGSPKASRQESLLPTYGKSHLV